VSGIASASNTATYVDAGTHHRLQTITGLAADGGGKAYTYDATGNTVTETLNAAANLTYTYDHKNRMRTVRTGTNTADTVTYSINALGQRVRKLGAGVHATNAAALSKTARFMYDESGRLVGEYDNQGRLIQETVWFGDLPVATIRPKGANASTPLGTTSGTGANNNLGTNTQASPVLIDMFYVHPDHLGTPRLVSEPTDNKKVWEWHGQAFGETAPNESERACRATFRCRLILRSKVKRAQRRGRNQNPQNITGAAAANAQFRYNVRFPGQFHDAESGRHYNYFRDYDAATGRYVQSDPIGLRAGMNTYAYVKSRPLKKVDPKGLDGYDPPYPPPRPPQRPDGNEWGWGCGDKDTDHLVPDAPFLSCCREHDICYERCGSSRDRCDKDFCKCNFGVCLVSLVPLPCHALASVYCQAVKSFGEPGYRDGQKNCGCLPPPNLPSEPSPNYPTF
jgi:RHS repeat-associated protein